jgi:hypothetical protein
LLDVCSFVFGNEIKINNKNIEVFVDDEEEEEEEDDDVERWRNR